MGWTLRALCPATVTQANNGNGAVLSKSANIYVFIQAIFFFRYRSVAKPIVVSVFFISHWFLSIPYELSFFGLCDPQQNDEKTV